MPRRRRWRRFFRKNLFFSNQETYQFMPFPPKNPEPVYITREELEILKMSDLDGMKHEEIAEKIGVSRPTITRVVNDARKKLIKAVYEGRPLFIIFQQD